MNKMTKQTETITPINPVSSWLTPDLVAEVKKVFEPRYKRSLTDTEVVAIAENLTGLLEVFFKYKFRTTNKLGFLTCKK